MDAVQFAACRTVGQALPPANPNWHNHSNSSSIWPNAFVALLIRKKQTGWGMNSGAWYSAVALRQHLIERKCDLSISIADLNQPCLWIESNLKFRTPR
jgi:hypothetical protein